MSLLREYLESILLMEEGGSWTSPACQNLRKNKCFDIKTFFNVCKSDSFKADSSCLSTPLFMTSNVRHLYLTNKCSEGGELWGTYEGGKCTPKSPTAEPKRGTEREPSTEPAEREPSTEPAEREPARDNRLVKRTLSILQQISQRLSPRNLGGETGLLPPSGRRLAEASSADKESILLTLQKMGAEIDADGSLSVVINGVRTKILDPADTRLYITRLFVHGVTKLKDPETEEVTDVPKSRLKLKRLYHGGTNGDPPPAIKNIKNLQSKLGEPLPDDDPLIQAMGNREAAFVSDDELKVLREKAKPSSVFSTLSGRDVATIEGDKVKKHVSDDSKDVGIIVVDGKRVGFRFPGVPPREVRRVTPPSEDDLRRRYPDNPQQQEKVRAQFEAYNKRVDALIENFETGKYGIVHIIPTDDNVSNAATAVAEMLTATFKLTPEQQARVSESLKTIQANCKADASTCKQALENAWKEIIKISESFPTTALPYIAETMTVFEELCKGRIAVITTGADYPTADVITLANADLPKFPTGGDLDEQLKYITVSLAMTSVKLGEGAAASLPERLKSVTFKNEKDKKAIETGVELYGKVTGDAQQINNTISSLTILALKNDVVASEINKEIKRLEKIKKPSKEEKQKLKQLKKQYEQRKNQIRDEVIREEEAKLSAELNEVEKKAEQLVEENFDKVEQTLLCDGCPMGDAYQEELNRSTEFRSVNKKIQDLKKSKERTPKQEEELAKLEKEYKQMQVSAAVRVMSRGTVKGAVKPRSAMIDNALAHRKKTGSDIAIRQLRLQSLLGFACDAVYNASPRIENFGNYSYSDRPPYRAETNGRDSDSQVWSTYSHGNSVEFTCLNGRCYSTGGTPKSYITAGSGERQRRGIQENFTYITLTSWKPKNLLFEEFLRGIVGRL